MIYSARKMGWLSFDGLVGSWNFSVPLGAYPFDWEIYFLFFFN